MPFGGFWRTHTPRSASHVCGYFIILTYFVQQLLQKRKGGHCGGVHLSLSYPDLGGHDHQTTLSHCDRDRDHYPDSVSPTKELRPAPTLQL